MPIGAKRRVAGPMQGTIKEKGMYSVWHCYLERGYCVNVIDGCEFYLTHGRHFADDIFKCIFLNENIWIPITISIKFVSKGPINNIPALVQIMAWRRPGDNPLSEPIMVALPTHICVTRPQWVKTKSHVNCTKINKIRHTKQHSNNISYIKIKKIIMALIPYKDAV